MKAFLIALAPFVLALACALVLGGCGSAADYMPKGTGEPGATGTDGSTGSAGRDGTDGAKGSAGSQGQTGASGRDGASGAAGARGAPGFGGLGDTWTDPDTDKAWTIVAKAETFADARCPAGMALPPLGVPYKLIDFFLVFYATLPTSASYWTSVGGTIGQITRTLASNGTNMADSDVTEKHLVICTEL